MLSEDALMRAVRAVPGQTSRQIAARLDAPFRKIGTRLSKLALYGKIDRDIIRKPPGSMGPHRWFVYRAKEAT